MDFKAIIFAPVSFERGKEKYEKENMESGKQENDRVEKWKERKKCCCTTKELKM